MYLAAIARGFAFVSWAYGVAKLKLQYVFVFSLLWFQFCLTRNHIFDGFQCLLQNVYRNTDINVLPETLRPDGYMTSKLRHHGRLFQRRRKLLCIVWLMPVLWINFNTCIYLWEQMLKLLLKEINTHPTQRFWPNCVFRRSIFKAFKLYYVPSINFDKL